MTDRVFSDECKQINHWAQEVAKHKRQRRTGLTGISHNLRSSKTANHLHKNNTERLGAKRKSQMGESEPTKRGRGRPPRVRPAADPKVQNSFDKSTPVHGEFNNAPMPLLQKAQTQSSGSRQKSISPRKNAMHIDQRRTPTNIDMPYLARCNPRVIRKDFQKAKATYNIPKSVLDLHSRLQDVPSGLIPLELKVNQV